MNVEWHRTALQELVEAAQYYDTQRIGLEAIC